MSVNAKHAQYRAMEGRWERCRAVMEGQDHIHTAGEKYLPKLTEQTPEEYRAYVTRTPFYNATWRTIAGLTGMILKKPPQHEVPDQVDEMLDDVTLSGTPITLFAKGVIEETLGLGRSGVLVDYPQVDTRAVTMADAKTLNLRPMMHLYKAENCINWRCEFVNNVYTLTMVVLREYAMKQKDEFEQEAQEQFRVLDLVHGGPTGRAYRVRVFEVHEGKDIQIGGDVFPLMNGKPLDFIPFTFIGIDGIGADVEEPPLIDLVDMNLSHYRTTADLEHGAHFTGLPTPWIAGHQEETEADGSPKKLRIGSSAAWVFRDPNAKAQYLEFTGQGLEALEKLIDRKERLMAILGARMLEQQKKAVETAESQTNQKKGEESMLSAASQVIALGIKRALEWFTLWAGADASNVEFELNRDFYPAPMTPQMLGALVSSWQQGAISDETLFDNLQRGEIIGEERTLEEEQAAIGDAAPKLSGAPDNVQPLRKEQTVIEGNDGTRYTVKRD